ncbi:MAG: hypothetical protein ACI9U2_001733 [Bradymonadia bacterium]|jgi:hypothetical protein
MLLNVLAILLATPQCAPLAAKPACEGALPVYADGCARRWVCPADLAKENLTRLDLSDAWLPAIFEAGTPEEQPYRSVYLKLAAGEIDDDEVEGRAAQDQFFETYGIFPNLTLVRRRLLQTARHVCREDVQDTELSAYPRVVSAYEKIDRQRKRIKTALGLARRFRRELTKRATAKAVEAGEPEAELPKFTTADFDKLGEEKRWRWSVRKWARAHPQVAAVRAAQAHLVCEGLMKKIARPGLLDFRTFVPLQAFQRKLMLGARSHLDAETRDSLVLDSRVADYQALLRALRERVRATTGLIEDGSALGQWGTVFGQQLDTTEYRHPLPDVPLANGAADFVSPATEAAAKALGWVSPAAAIARLATMETLGSLVIAVKLPPPPAWHSAHMELRGEIDRGDVWYDYPVAPNGKTRHQPITRRANLTLYAQHGDKEIALVRWPTTIGSWKTEATDGGATVYKYKNSDVGPRVWRKLVAGPSWLPPDSTPNEDLVERRGRRYRAKRDIFGPSYASAFGLVMMIHERAIEGRDGQTKYYDRGIRVHGSVSYRSIMRGSSHGCHRLFNHLAVRLGSFVLRHRKHTIEGPIPTTYGRNFDYKGHRINLRIPSRGFGYVFDPPVPINVLRGRVRGYTHKVPKEARAVPE